MAYADLYADASLYYGLDNSYSYVTTAEFADEFNAAYTATPIFVADAPSNTGSTYSMQLSNYAGTNRPSRKTFRNFSGAISGTGRTITFWFKFKKAGGGSFAIGDSTGSSITFAYTDPTSGTSDNDNLVITKGINSLNMAASDRKVTATIREVTTAEAGTVSALSSNEKFEQDKWYHFAYVEQHQSSTNTIERAMYLNGSPIGFSKISSRNGFMYEWGRGAQTPYGFYPFQTSGADASDNLMAHYAVWAHRALSKEEIRAQAWYGLSNSDYKTKIIADSPIYYTTLDNEDTNTDPSIYGTNTNWGPLNDNGAAISVNNLGFPDDKSWKSITNSTAITDSYLDTTNPDMISGIPALQRTGEYSIEFWAKMDAKPSANRYLFASQATNQNGYLAFYMSSTGNWYFNSSYKSGASTYTNGTVQNLYFTGLSEFSPGSSDNTSGFCDGEWHHIVYTQTNTEAVTATAGSYYGSIYVDGLRASRAWTNTYGWLDGTGDATAFRIGNSTVNTLVRDALFDNVAFYNRRLTYEEILDHYVTGMTYTPPATRTVKYWDGTTWADSTAQKVWNGSAWVEWDASRWDGSAWVAV